jgi:hypothetical protein
MKTKLGDPAKAVVGRNTEDVKERDFAGREISR